MNVVFVGALIFDAWPLYFLGFFVEVGNLFESSANYS